MEKRRIVVLGSTGSIGTQTLDVVRQHSDQLEVVGLAAHSRTDEVVAQARAFEVCHVAFGDEALASDSRIDEARQVVDAIAAAHPGEEGTVGVGPDAVLDLVRLPEVDVVVNALVGAAGLRASYETLACGKVLALANKESLVVGGDLIMPLAAQVDEARRAAGLAPAVGPAGALMPIDSEHGAIYQCLLGENPREVSKLWVTASGGPFRGKTRADLHHITPAQALAHPTWNMGAKISIDSSTLMNKGLEVIEAHHLFAMPYDKIEVVVQPQSAIHSMVEFTDGSVKAHLGTTDMRIPIQFALSYPDRWEAPVAPLDFRTLGTLEFAAPDTHTFRCLALARSAGERGGTLPCVMNAANEVAVAEFLAGSIGYLDIAACVEAAMDAHQVEPVESLEQLEEVDARTRLFARGWCGTHPLA
ncbi:1-deoxy-D-xylulose-5-phosphate reductoisomerase [Adlercreutzia equolifaciens]|uniref:1-deoxy-D-xylulose-5-phosphate reductoisomerase n=1 Tax=Adlercreutzia equolifaciens TaxID=446660 RepID=UPI0023B0C85B|nr:1-deoxy-D-xylulose-5-phosphate reductoisomerase [Adlercreutzia equolifaciens]MDE8701698.1 1-deoxy-D-xylulose-5-phosphate reductoisomerase [Adlercreutzia equolifaciens]